jgi:hypothetical protein
MVVVSIERSPQAQASLTFKSISCSRTKTIRPVEKLPLFVCGSTGTPHRFARRIVYSANILPASPAGPAYVAGAALRAGHTVEVFETLFSADPAADLEAQVRRFAPDVVAISIRLVNGYVVDGQSQGMEFNRRPFDTRPMVRSLVERVRVVSDARIILGGPGFNYFAEAWLTYLDLDYGLRGEGEVSFPRYLERVQQGLPVDDIPGCVVRTDGGFRAVERDRVGDLDGTALPAYELFDLAKYAERGISPAISSTRAPTSELASATARRTSPTETPKAARRSGSMIT